MTVRYDYRIDNTYDPIRCNTASYADLLENFCARIALDTLTLRHVRRGLRKFNLVIKQYSQILIMDPTLKNPCNSLIEIYIS